MESEQVLDIPVRRYIIESERSFPDVLDGIFGGISRPDITSLFGDLEASTSYEQFSSLGRQAQGAAGLMRSWQRLIRANRDADTDVWVTLRCYLVPKPGGNSGHQVSRCQN